LLERRSSRGVGGHAVRAPGAAQPARAAHGGGTRDCSRRVGRAAGAMLFFSFFKTLEGKEVTVELKNSLCIRGTLHSVDQFLNCKLSDISVVDTDKHPHLMSVKNIFIRGSVVRYVHMAAADVDVPLLQDATRREYKEGKAAS
jgi:small nuclear ribonucleoprotein (snRNP)-like protein